MNEKFEQKQFDNKNKKEIFDCLIECLISQSTRKIIMSSKMSSYLKNNEIRIKVIKLKRSFDLEIKNNKNSIPKTIHQLNLSSLKTSQFQDYEEVQTANNHQSSAEFSPLTNKSMDNKRSLRQYETSSKQSPVRKLPNLSYKDQKSQKSIKQQSAIGELKQMRSISINYFVDRIPKIGKIRTKVWETLQKYKNKIQKGEQKFENNENVKIDLKRRIGSINKSKRISTKGVQKKRLRSEQGSKQEKQLIQISFWGCEKRGEYCRKSKDRKFLIEPWEVIEQSFG